MSVVELSKFSTASTRVKPDSILLNSFVQVIKERELYEILNGLCKNLFGFFLRDQ